MQRLFIKSFMPSAQETRAVKLVQRMALAHVPAEPRVRRVPQPIRDLQQMLIALPKRVPAGTCLSQMLRGPQPI